MRITYPTLAAVAVTLIGIHSASGQSDPMANAVAVPRADISLGYTYINANAPPGGCKCFGLNGGYASASFRVKDWLSAAGEFTGGHANDISLLGQDLTLKTFLGGPRVSLIEHRFVPYGQVLFGIAHASDSYFPVGNSYETSATSFAYTAGGGLDVELNHRLAIRAIEGQFLHTGFPNASNNAQNHMVISAGIVFKLGARELKAPDHIPLPPPPPPAPVVVQAPPRPQIAFSCSTSVVNTTPGEPVEVLGNTMAQPDGLDVTYAWTTTGGTIEGSGSSVTVHTDGLAPGRYHVTGHVVASSDATVTASCEVGFHVNAAPAVAAGPTPADLKAANQQQDHAFHENVKDAYFDYDKWNIRPDTQAAINNAAEYLKQHPDLNVLVGGYSDERGTSEYNVALGLRRSEATRNALIAQGIDPERIQVISYGKGTQVCTTENEACWQQNRRAAFELHR